MEHGCNMGTVLVLHFILFMQHKNRPHIAIYHCPKLRKIPIEIDPWFVLYSNL